MRRRGDILGANVELFTRLQWLRLKGVNNDLLILTLSDTLHKCLLAQPGRNKNCIPFDLRLGLTCMIKSMQ